MPTARADLSSIGCNRLKTQYGGRLVPNPRQRASDNKRTGFMSDEYLMGQLFDEPYHLDS